jgi:primosomal protein N''
VAAAARVVSRLQGGQQQQQQQQRVQIDLVARGEPKFEVFLATPEETPSAFTAALAAATVSSSSSNGNGSSSSSDEEAGSWQQQQQQHQQQRQRLFESRAALLSYRGEPDPFSGQGALDWLQETLLWASEGAAGRGLPPPQSARAAEIQQDWRLADDEKDSFFEALLSGRYSARAMTDEEQQSSKEQRQQQQQLQRVDVRYISPTPCLDEALGLRVEHVIDESSSSRFLDDDDSSDSSDSGSSERQGDRRQEAEWCYYRIPAAIQVHSRDKITVTDQPGVPGMQQMQYAAALFAEVFRLHNKISSSCTSTSSSTVTSSRKMQLSNLLQQAAVTAEELLSGEDMKTIAGSSGRRSLTCRRLTSSIASSSSISSSSSSSSSSSRDPLQGLYLGPVFLDRDDPQLLQLQMGPDPESGRQMLLGTAVTGDSEDRPAGRLMLK